MRLLVACPECERQFDATGRRIGSRFRCHCGATVTVEPSVGHDASVVRCESCGAPRREATTECKFCGANFTLHERDLDTVCPKCFARVSDRAKFCHHCATPLVPESFAGEQTPLVCPACQEDAQMVSRRIGHVDVTVLECGRCAGIWLGNDVFSQLTQRAAEAAARLESSGKPRPTVVGSGAAPARGKTSFYRPCPRCGALMPRRQYGRRSGVVIDVCREHGVWLDAEELPQILAWIRAGGAGDGEDAGKPKERSRAAANAAGGGQAMRRGDAPINPPGDSWSILARAAMETLWLMFR